MAHDNSSAASATVKLQRPVDPARDHVRGGGVPEVVTVVGYAVGVRGGEGIEDARRPKPSLRRQRPRYRSRQH